MEHDELLEQAIEAWREKGYSREDILHRWDRRIKPFDFCEINADDRPQVMPFPRPPVKAQTEPWAKS